MSDITIITDSTAYLPAEMLETYGIRSLPLKVIWGEESLDDGIDISPVAFYERLAQSDTMPTTSQVTVGEFIKLFDELTAAGQQILVIPISSGISGTVASAEQAKAERPDAPIYIVDSESTTVHMALIVLAAARAVQAGESLEACIAIAEKARENSGVVFAVDTLEFLHRGGRIGGAKRMLATMLNIKPILTMTAGKVDALDQARTRKKSIIRIADIVAERVNGKSNVRIGVSHANAAEDAQRLLDMVVARVNPVETLMVELSPVIGTHVGPGTLALAYHFEA